MRGTIEQRVHLKDKAATEAYMQDFAACLERGDLVLLEGELGAGKTTMVQWIARYFAVEEQVTSPTFALANHYRGQLEGEPLDIYHLDLYRLEDPAELEDLDYEDYFYPETGLSFVEWPDRAEAYLPPSAIRLQIRKGEGEEREVSIQCAC